MLLWVGWFEFAWHVQKTGKRVPGSQELVGIGGGTVGMRMHAHEVEGLYTSWIECLALVCAVAGSKVYESIVMRRRQIYAVVDRSSL